ncbi:hypothetical protein [Allosphingosinicella vermicomposti]|uniref:hypothetical protein n=1 Tax=Allosphingosinicella vermicomposti TaxID=614671 RepID=UPI000D0E97A6|nr:hypothetical protein [Allosphingosinicella vermicomposti]
MKPWRNKGLILAGAALAAIAIPALSQETPESILPPGFNDPETLPPPVQTPPPAPPRAPVAPVAAPTDTVITDAAEEDLAAIAAAQPRRQPGAFDLPDDARRDPSVVGVIGPADWGLAPDAFGAANGRFLSSLMRRMDAPLPSRWASILLRRALISRTAAPGAVQPVDWVAERAWLLLRMGEADAARMLVQQVDVDLYTPKMMEVAAQTALATADPAALCPLVEPGKAMSSERIWPLADAMCAALAGEPARASSLVDQARGKSGNADFDLLLAEKIVGAGSDTRRAVNLQWDGVDGLNAWRFGMAAAAGVDIPGALMDRASPHIWAWQARAPMIPLDRRVAAAHVAASLGVFSSSALVEMHSLLADRMDPSERGGTIAERLGRAYAGGFDERLAALNDLWDDEGSAAERHARLIMTAGAAARIAPSAEREAASGRIVAAMLAAGMDRRAARWLPVSRGFDEESGLLAWSLLAVGAPDGGAADRGRLNDAIDANESRGRLLIAALAGLGRLDMNAASDLASDYGFALDERNLWTDALDRAVSRRQAGAVAILAAAGMQTGDWRGVPPQHLYRITRALHAVGLDFEARMIAAEALYRV